MKLAIICLLAFCAFKTVSADLKQQLDNLYLKTMEQVGNITTPVQNDINARAAAAEGKKIKIGSCESEATVAVQDFVNKSEQEAQKCVDDATKTLSYHKVRSCCQAALDTLGRNLSEVVPALQKCIDNCAATKRCESD